MAETQADPQTDNEENHTDEF